MNTITEESTRTNFYETHSINVDGVTFTYYKTGQGKCLFMVPAFHSDINRFESLLRFLGSYFTVYIPELPGVSTNRTLGNHRHTMKNYSRFLTTLISELNLDNYVLAGFCLGGPIVYYMLTNKVRTPTHIILFEGLYDSKYIHLGKKYQWVLKIIFAVGIENNVVKKVVNLLLHNTNILTLYFRHLYKHEKNIQQVIKNQIRLTEEMNTKAWLELVYDIFHFHLEDGDQTYTIPTLLIYNNADGLLDLEKTINGMQKLFPNSQVIKVALTLHAPPGPISEDFVKHIIQPLVPSLIEMSKR